jgi:hypothetical protein
LVGLQLGQLSLRGLGALGLLQAVLQLRHLLLQRGQLLTGIIRQLERPGLEVGVGAEGTVEP